MTGTVGIAGLGIMGGAIARNLRSEGWRVIGFDPDSDACAKAKSAGVEIAADLADLARAASDILTSLPSAAAVAATAQAIAANGLGPRTMIDTSTLALEDKMAFAKVLGEAGHIALDCPLSGTGAQAQTRDLVILASGDSATIERLQPLFLGFGRRAFDLGQFGNGSRMKFVANQLVAIHNVAAAEALVLGMKAGLDPHKIVEVIGSGAGTSRMFELRAPMMADNRYRPATMKSELWQKDMSVIGAFAAAAGSPTPLFDATKAIYEAGLEMGHGDDDTASVCAVLEAMAGLTRRV